MNQSHFSDLLEMKLFTLGQREITLAMLGAFVVFLVGLAVFARLTRTFIVPRLLKRTKVDIGVAAATSRIAGYFIWLIGALIGLPLIGIEVHSVVLAFSALGVGLGFGLQQIADNFVSGLILLFERPVKVGDRIQVGDLYGTITEIRARSTSVQTNENLVVLVPNSQLISNSVVNLTHNGPMVRFRFPVGVSYGSDVEEVRAALLAVAAAHPRLLDAPPPEALFLGFGDSSLNFVLRAGTTSAVHSPDVLLSEINYAIWHELKRRKIEIPFPQRDLHIKSVSPHLAGKVELRVADTAASVETAPRG